MNDLYVYKTESGISIIANTSPTVMFLWTEINNLKPFNCIGVWRYKKIKIHERN